MRYLYRQLVYIYIVVTGMKYLHSLMIYPGDREASIWRGYGLPAALFFIIHFQKQTQKSKLRACQCVCGLQETFEVGEDNR